MSKLDWSKASLREADPARAQPVRDFVEPDPIIITITDLTPKEKKQQAAKLARLEAHKRGKPRLKTTQKASRAHPVKAKPDRAERIAIAEEKRLAAETRKAAKAAHHERYLAKAAQREAAINTKKKSHLEAWAEGQDGLKIDRQTLHRSWRSRLLGDKRSKQDDREE